MSASIAVPSFPPVPEYVSDFILVVEGVISDQDCQHLIDRFEQDTAHQRRHDMPDLPSGAGFHFTELNVTQHWPDKVPGLTALFQYAAQGHAEHTGMRQWFHHPAPIADIRIKRYRPGDSFPLHLDQYDRHTCDRALAMFLYLNDVPEGGETAFPQWEMAVRPAAGRLLSFPPGRPYLHEGRPPIGGLKYILGTYALHP